MLTVPELPEVELVRRGLAQTVLDRRIESVDVHAAGSLVSDAGALGRALVGRRLRTLDRRGKTLIAELDDGAFLLMHLMMTGQCIVAQDGQTIFAGGHPSPSLSAPMPDHTTRLTIRMAGGRTLFFNDGRRFARVRVLDAAGLRDDPFLGRLGPEPLTDAFTTAALQAQLRRHRRAPVKAVLLDQSAVAGIGNIYADEALHLARLHPLRRAGSLNAGQAARLRDAIRTVLQTALDSGATSTANGYRPRVFGNEGEPCPVCGTPIRRIRAVGRSTYLCPRCQRPPKPKPRPRPGPRPGPTAPERTPAQTQSSGIVPVPR